MEYIWNSQTGTVVKDVDGTPMVVKVTRGANYTQDVRTANDVTITV